LSVTPPHTELYRAVRGAEAENIRNTGVFTNPPGIEAKYFALSLGGARTYASRADTQFDDGPYHLVKTTIRSDLISPSMLVSVDGGIETVVLPTHLLPHLALPELLE
jgi:hypothetical protein